MVIDDDEEDANLEMDFQRYLGDEETKKNKSEINIYLSDGVERGETDDFDVFLWYKTTSIILSILSYVPKNVLTIHITTVISESTFSTKS